MRELEKDNTKGRVGFWRAALASALLCGLFFLAYGGTNALAAHRGIDRSMYFGWERHIPFVPILIVPYMSIDLLFVVAPFLCRSNRELKVLASRMGLGVVIASACFLVFPLKFSFTRPEASGWLGDVFHWFRGMDQPYNQLPSLHMTLRTILAVHYARHLPGVWRWVSNAWFVLIGLSTVLTYQHHVIDVFGGILLGIFCVWAVTDEPPPEATERNHRVGAYYGTAAMLLLGAGLTVLALSPMPWRAGGVALLYLGLGFALAAMGYFRWGPHIYRKTNGRLHWTSRALLAPVLIGQHLSLRHYAGKSERWNAITDRIWLGRYLGKSEAAELKDAGVVAVLDVTCEFHACADLPGLAYRSLPVLDLTRPSAADIDRAVAFLNEHAARGPVYVHCKAGYSRSAAIVGAYLIRTGIVASAGEAADLLRAKRPAIVLRPEVLRVLEESAQQPKPATPST